MGDNIEDRINRLEVEAARNGDLLRKFENLGETLVRMDGRIESLVTLLSEAKVTGYPRCQDREFRIAAVEKDVDRLSKGETISFAYIKDDVKSLQQTTKSLSEKVDPLVQKVTRWSAVIGVAQLILISVLLPIALRYYFH